MYVTDKPGGSNRELLAATVDKYSRFQRKWQTITMCLYVFSTTGIIVASTAGTILAALGYSKSAAVLAASVALLSGAEKGLLFREKWKLHLAVKTKLENLALDIRVGTISVEAAAGELKRIVYDYASDLPVEQRVSPK